MDFSEYRDSIGQIQRLATHYAKLNKSEVAELNTLNQKCLSMKDAAINSFSKLVDEVEGGLTHLIDRLEQIKKDLVTISGPEGTMEDTLRLESVWASTNELNNNIKRLLEAKAFSPESESCSLQKSQNSTETAIQADTKKLQGVQDLIEVARIEAAAVVEKSPAVKLLSAGNSIEKTIKKEIENRHSAMIKKEVPQKKEEKNQPRVIIPNRPINAMKVCGETEKKLMEEINKNIELIKNSKKK